MSGHAIRTFADRLKEAQSGMSNEDLAAAVGVRLRTVTRWRGGYSEPHGEDLARLCHALDRPAEFFYPPEEVAA